MKKRKTYSSKKVAYVKTTASSPVRDVTRHITGLNRLKLFVESGGRCEFDGCNRYLLEHHVTLTDGNFAEVAHIVAFSVGGPRGKSGRPADVNDPANLMTLCPGCHKLIDDNPTKFTKATLLGYKLAHERRIRHVTGLGPDQKTTVLVLKSRIGQQTVTIPFDHILEAVTPRYPSVKDPFVIDLTQIPANSPTFIATACDTIREELRTFFGANADVRRTNHVSLFALSSIPILAFLGSQMSNKVPIDLFQRHRDTEKWSWKSSGPNIDYEFASIRNGTDRGRVGLLLSLSGAIDHRKLPPNVDGSYFLYELTLADGTPAPTFLNQKQDLERFRVAYQTALAFISKEHPGLPALDLFPAVPAPIAFLCGRELLPKVHPEVRIYDNDKRAGGFTQKIILNNI